jgi:hypothetical protein
MLVRFTLGLFLLTVFHFAVVWLTVREYRRNLRRALEGPRSARDDLRHADARSCQAGSSLPNARCIERAVIRRPISARAPA